MSVLVFYLLLSQRDLTLTCQGSWIQLWTVTSLLSSMSKVAGWCLLRKIAKQGSSLYLCIFENAFEKAKETLHGKPYFLFPDVLKRWSFQKNWAGIWSSLYYQERWYFLFPKIWSYTLDGKWKMIFLKIYTEIWYFLQALLKDGLSKRGRAGTWSFLYYLKRWYFSPENMIFFPWAESERRSCSGNTWKHDASPSEEKQGTWYIGSRFGPSLNLFG